MKRYSRMIASLLVLVLALSGCSSGSTGHVYSGGDIVVEITHEPDDTPSSSASAETPAPAVESTPAVSQTPDESAVTEEPSERDAASAVLSAVAVTTLARPFLLNTLTKVAESAQASAQSYTVKSDLSDVYNLNQFHFSDQIKNLLAKNLFAVQMNSSYEFFEEYESNRYEYIPNFVTTDAMMHTYHLYFSYLLKNTEKNYLLASLKELTSMMLQNSLAQYNDLKGSEWETAALRNSAFFAVGASLLGVAADVPAEVKDLAEEELSNIYEKSSMKVSPIASLGLEESVTEDYTQYTVRGYYEGDADLENYFRAMMWYGRLNFRQRNEDLDRSSLLMTLAMDDNAFPVWEQIYAVTSFFAGASDDLGYYEYRPAIDAVYGSSVTAKDLAGDKDKWTIFHLTTGEMDPPLINTTSVNDDGTVSENKGFRFMGQRFSVDGVIFENLVYEQVGANDKGEYRMLPDALDVPAAMGSEEALDILKEKGADKYAGYLDNMALIRDDIENASDLLWEASLYSKWLDTLDPLLNEERTGWPSFMQSAEWTRKNLQSYLGSYAELKHDTVLYSKQIMTEMGGNDIQEWDDKGYVEPEPVLFGRLAALTKATSEGLSNYGMLSAPDMDNLDRLYTLASSLQTIAEKELRGETPTEEEFELIRGFGGSIEHFWKEVNRNEAEKLTTKEFPAAIVTDIATDGQTGNVLEIATGRVSTIYVIVPVDGKLKICAGSVFSFYEFPSSERLTDSKWRRMMNMEVNENGRYNDKPAYFLEDWTRGFQINYWENS